MKPLCGARLGARRLTASSTVARTSQHKLTAQRSREYSTGTSGEISPAGIDSSDLIESCRRSSGPLLLMPK
jgi:hypothetical protein